jgi:DNA invertase Pin-like site-specific DNA recombinase
MINDNGHQKVTDGHLQRDAYLYVRQSTLRQVFQNTESTKRQYALRQRAVALGWPIERVIVIDCDQGQSGALEDREGFQKLVAEVGMGHAGIVLGLEVSRLARNSVDWHRLLQICALTHTLILDEDGLYDPCHFNDRILLGLKGTISEAELHVIKSRMRGGIVNKARRGQLKMPMPVGLVYDHQYRVILDPDRQVQKSIHYLFQAYQQTSSAIRVVKLFREQGLLFPRRLRSGPQKGQLVWGPITHSRVLQILHNPWYAGAFAFGRTRTYKKASGGNACKKLPQHQWHTLIPDAHPGYITWEQYQDNQRRLHESAQAHGLERRKSPPGQGPALLQGLVVCGICGKRMTVRYHSRQGHLEPDYACQRQGIEHAQPVCQLILGTGIDKAVGELLLEMVAPMTLEVAWAVQQELQVRLDEADQLRKQQVERTRYEADLAQNRYMQVDPNNRLVADELEADWNAKLRVLAEAQQQYEQQRQADRMMLDDEIKDKVLTLATDFPKVWHDPETSDRDRKRMVRLLIEDVTLTKNEQIKIQIRFKGGATRTLVLPLPKGAGELRKTSSKVVSEIDRLLDEKTDEETALQLNKHGYKAGTGCAFTRLIVAKIRINYKLKSHFTRLREAGMLTESEIAEELGICTGTVKIWRRHGLLRARRYNEKNEYLYEPVGNNRPVKNQGIKLSKRRVFPDQTNEVQDEV